MPYVKRLFEQDIYEKIHGLTFVDLGCGDFQVGLKLLPLCSHFTGVDIVKPLIDNLSKEFFQLGNVNFIHMDLINEELPDADVCFLRQVLQHLSNEQILKILQKLNKYRYVFLTEHYPSDNDKILPNLDKTHGGGIRLTSNSGVYITMPPFNIPDNKIDLILEVEGSNLGSKFDSGVIRTFLYTP